MFTGFSIEPPATTREPPENLLHPSKNLPRSTGGPHRYTWRTPWIHWRYPPWIHWTNPGSTREPLDPQKNPWIHKRTPGSTKELPHTPRNPVPRALSRMFFQRFSTNPCAHFKGNELLSHACSFGNTIVSVSHKHEVPFGVFHTACVTRCIQGHINRHYVAVCDAVCGGFIGTQRTTHLL